MKKALLLITTLAFALQAHAADKLTLMLDWFINPDHAPIIVAKQKGWFKAHGLEVDIQEPADPALPPKLVAAGKTDLAVSYQPSLMIQVSEGLPLTRTGTLVATPLNSLIVLENSDIKSLKDLKGKKIGFSVSGFEDAALKAMLATVGLDISKDVKLVNVNWSLSPSLVAGNVDAVIGAYRNFELNEMDIENHPGRAFYVEEHGVPAYDELIFVANNDKLKDAEYRERVRKFNYALELATQYLLNHPDDAWTLFKDYKPKDLDNELNRRAWKDTLTRFALRPNALDRARYQRVAEFIKQQGLIKTIPALDSYAIEP